MTFTINTVHEPQGKIKLHNININKILHTFNQFNM